MNNGNVSVERFKTWLQKRNGLRLRLDRSCYFRIVKDWVFKDMGSQILSLMVKK